MDWTWDPKKNRSNERDHSFGFEVAQLVFDDPLAVTQRDPYPDEERWQTIGTVGNLLLFVVHTWPEEETVRGRIISARKAARRERTAYEHDKT